MIIFPKIKLKITIFNALPYFLQNFPLESANGKKRLFVKLLVFSLSKNVLRIGRRGGVQSGFIILKLFVKSA